MARSDALGAERHVTTAHGQLAFRERGDGPAVVFVHGLFANADLWRDVVPGVADAGFRCLSPDLPLGGHDLPAAPDADLSPPGMANLLARFMEELDLEDVTVVANDTGGAIVQILMATNPGRIGRVVLTPSDALERFFPPIFRFLHLAGWIPGSVRLTAHITGRPALQRLPLVFGWLAKRPLPAEVGASFNAPLRRDRRVRRDVAKFLRTAHRRQTLAAAEQLPAFDRPVLLAWAREDKLFPVSLARRLGELLPDARLELVDDAYTFIPLDQPEVLVGLITRFAAPRAPAR